MTIIPLFPLNLVLFPTMVLPLHIFEPRYRALVHDVLEGDREFGVLMIERGVKPAGKITVPRLERSQEWLKPKNTPMVAGRW